jgi:acetyltransferase-like isoleucine patch superfamily enzyme
MVAVGDDTEIGPGLHVQTNEHQWSDVNKSLAKQQSISLPVKIGSGSYLGANVTVLRGVDVGDQCVVAAGAVIVKSLPSRGVYGGVPAKRINNIEPVKISDPSGSL